MVQALAALAFIAAITTASSAASVEFRAAAPDPQPGLVAMTPLRGDATVYVEPDPLLTSADIAGAKVGINRETKQFVVRIIFTPDGAARLTGVTTEHQGELLAIVIDGQLLTAPKIAAPITGREAIIQGKFTRAEAIRLALQIDPKASTAPEP